MKRTAGFTLVELMISAAVMGVVVVYLTTSFTTQHRAYTVVDQVTQAQQNLRTLSSLLEREVRHAGFLVPESAALCAVDQTTGSDILFLADQNAIDPAGVTDNDLGAVVAGGVPNSLAALTLTGTVTLTVDDTTLDGAPAYDNDGDGIADTDFQNGAGLILADRENPSRGAICGRISVTPTGTQLQFNILPQGGGSLAAGPLGANPPVLVAVPANIYVVNAPTLQLIRNGNVLAEDVEDLQIAYFFDVDGNGLVASNALEYPGSSGGGLVYQSNQWNNADLREVRVNLVVRSSRPDPDYTEGQFQITENRAAPLGGGNDGFRRRVVQTVVRPRNVGAR